MAVVYLWQVADCRHHRHRPLVWGVDPWVTQQ